MSGEELIRELRTTGTTTSRNDGSYEFPSDVDLGELGTLDEFG